MKEDLYRDYIRLSTNCKERFQGGTSIFLLKQISLRLDIIPYGSPMEEDGMGEGRVGESLASINHFGS